jgi:hypothetical protein
MSKKRKVYPTLRPPVEDEPEQVVREWPKGEEITEIYEPRPRIADARATEAARGYRCPSHGRSRFATATWDNGWRIDGVCCRDAEAAIIAGLDG